MITVFTIAASELENRKSEIQEELAVIVIILPAMWVRVGCHYISYLSQKFGISRLNKPNLKSVIGVARCLRNKLR